MQASPHLVVIASLAEKNGLSPAPAGSKYQGNLLRRRKKQFRKQRLYSPPSAPQRGEHESCKMIAREMPKIKRKGGIGKKTGQKNPQRFRLRVSAKNYRLKWYIIIKTSLCCSRQNTRFICYRLHRTGIVAKTTPPFEQDVTALNNNQQNNCA